MSEFPPRVHVLLARRAPLGVIIRRGPSKQVCTLLWDRRVDTFKVGQWLKGRIYERRSDLSPDGTHLIYFAMNGHWQSEARGAWTAISRAPYLKALALFPKGDCWYGGGMFTGTRTYWLNGWHASAPLRETREVQRDDGAVPVGAYGGECLSVYYPRLLRDGWTLVQSRRVPVDNRCDVFEKPLPGGWMLRKLAHAQSGPPPGRGVYWDEHALLHPATGAEIACPGWEWAERDGDRLVWAERGTLRTGRPDPAGLGDEAQLLDLNDMRFEALAAPY